MPNNANMADPKPHVCLIVILKIDVDMSNAIIQNSVVRNKWDTRDTLCTMSQ